MNKREERKRIEEILRENIEECEVWQDKPYTAVHVLTCYDDKPLSWHGFAKIQYPDEWDAAYGVELALSKAIAKLSKAIVNEV